MIRAFVDKHGNISTPDMLEFKAELTRHREHEIDITVKRRQRTLKQNAVLHWALELFSKGLKEIGYKIEMEDLKYELKQRGFFGWVWRLQRWSQPPPCHPGRHGSEVQIRAYGHWRDQL